MHIPGSPTSFTLTGTITPFAGNGRKLGYPTANIKIPLDTEEGLFIGTVELEGASHQAIIFVGAPVTMDETVKRGEAHILDFVDRDLYGLEITMHALHKLRDNQKFDSVEELIAQMDIDKQHTIAYYKQRKDQ